MKEESVAVFPKELTEEMLSRFRTAPRGCTNPRIGMIDGRKYIAKCGVWSKYSSDIHVHNEYVADRFLRAAGFAVPASKIYCVSFRDRMHYVRLARFVENARPLMDVWSQADETLKERIRGQVVRVYPIQLLMGGIHTFNRDNVLVDEDGTLLFVDNGSSFDFRASGKHKLWFWLRNNPDDPFTGYLSLFAHPDQEFLRELLRSTRIEELWRAMLLYDIKLLLNVLSDTNRKAKFAEFTQKLIERAREAVR